MVCSVHPSAHLFPPHHQTQAPAIGTHQQLALNSTGNILFTETGPHTPALVPGSMLLTNFDPPVDSQVPKIEDMKSRGEVQSPTWLPLGQTNLEKALQNMCIHSTDESSSQFHLVKPPQGNADPQNDTLDYLGLLCDLHSTQNLYAGTQKNI